MKFTSLHLINLCGIASKAGDALQVKKIIEMSVLLLPEKETWV